MELDFEVDKITESIENAETGEALETLVLPLDQAEVRGVNKKNGWLFDWKLEYAQADRQVYKLVTTEDTQTIHGLVSFEERSKHIYMHLIESSPFNKGKAKNILA